MYLIMSDAGCWMLDARYSILDTRLPCHGVAEGEAWSILVARILTSNQQPVSSIQQPASSYVIRSIGLQ